MKKKMGFSEAWRHYLKEFMDERGYQMDDFAVMDLQTIIFSVAAAVIALAVAVIIIGNIDTAVGGTTTMVNGTGLANLTQTEHYTGVVSNTSAYYPLLSIVGGYGVTTFTLLAIGIIVAGAAAILYIIRGSF